MVRVVGVSVVVGQRDDSKVMVTVKGGSDGVMHSIELASSLAKGGPDHHRVWVAAGWAKEAGGGQGPSAKTATGRPPPGTGGES